MKLLLVILAFAVAANAVPVRNDCDGSTTVSEDVSEILSGTVDIDGITQIMMDVLENPSPNAEAILYFLYGPEFRALLYAVMADQVAIDVYNYLTEEGGFNSDRFWRILDDYFGIQKPSVRAASTRNDFTDVVAELRAMIDWQTIWSRAQEKAESSCSFRDAVERVRSDHFRGMVGQLRENETFQHIVSALNEFGLDTSFIRDVIAGILNPQD